MSAVDELRWPMARLSRLTDGADPDTMRTDELLRHQRQVLDAVGEVLSAMTRVLDKPRRRLPESMTSTSGPEQRLSDLDKRLIKIDQKLDRIDQNVLTIMRHLGL